jgi:hypothetical protein
MKVFFFLLLFIISVKCIQSKKPIRTYVVRRDVSAVGNPLPEYSVYDTSEKKLSYRLKIVSSDIDTIILVDHPNKNIVANLEGEWTDKIFNVSFSIYDSKLSKWTDGNIKRSKGLFFDKFPVVWNGIRLVMKKKPFSLTRQFYEQPANKLIAQFRVRTSWTAVTRTKFDLKIFSDKVPDAIYFFMLAIVDQRQVIKYD